jgi:vacuolar protein sorting-associated protein 26
MPLNLTKKGTHAVRELDVPGEIVERKTYPFEFSTVEMQYESYNGVNVRLRYVRLLKDQVTWIDGNISELKCEKNEVGEVNGDKE